MCGDAPLDASLLAETRQRDAVSSPYRSKWHVNSREPRVMHTISRVLVPVDLEAIVWEPIEYAGRIARENGAAADLLYASRRPLSISQVHSNVRGDPDRESMLELMASIMECFMEAGDDPGSVGGGTLFIGHIHPGEPAEVILSFARRCQHDLIVMGSSGVEGFSHLGSEGVVETVVQYAPMPVLVVPSSGWEQTSDASLRNF